MDQIDILSNVLFGISWLTIALGIYCYVGDTSLLNIAGTQWLLISAVLGINGIYMKVSNKK